MPIPTGISGSRSAAIIGLSKYATPFTVWQSIMEARQPGFNAERGYLYEPFEGNAATEFGHAFENSVVYLTEQKLNRRILEREAVYSANEYTTCHIDGTIDSNKLFEGKHCNFRVFGMDWGEPGTDRVPTAIQCQVQHNMLCAGLSEAVVSVLVIPKTVQDFEEEGWKVIITGDEKYMLIKGEWTPGNQPIDPLEWAKVFAQIGNLHQYHIEAKPDTQKILMELYDEFWNKYVVEGVAPDAVDYSDIRAMFSQPKGTLIISVDDKIGGESVASLMREFKDITKEIGASGHLAKRKAFIKTQVLKFAADKTTVADDESVEKIVFRDESGNKLGSFNGKTYRS